MQCTEARRLSSWIRAKEQGHSNHRRKKPNFLPNVLGVSAEGRLHDPDPDVCPPVPPWHALSNWEFWITGDRRPEEAGRPKGRKPRDAGEAGEP